MKTTLQSIPLFRIGGVYRTRDGEVMRLEAFTNRQEMNGRPIGRAVPVCLESWQEHAGARYLDDGRYVHAFEDEPYGGDLVLGELLLLAGVWVKRPQYFGFDLGEPKRPALNWNKSTPFDPFKGYTVTRYDANEGMDVAPSGLASPDLTASSHQVPAAFGSASLHDKSMAKKVLAANLLRG